MRKKKKKYSQISSERDLRCTIKMKQTLSTGCKCKRDVLLFIFIINDYLTFVLYLYMILLINQIIFPNYNVHFMEELALS